MKLKVMPTTKQGRFASWFLLSFFFFIFVTQLIVASGQEGEETFFDNLWISVPVFLAVLSGLASLSTGLISFIKNKERSIIVFFAIFIGALLMVFLLGEFLFPH